MAKFDVPQSLFYRAVDRMASLGPGATLVIGAALALVLLLLLTILGEAKA